MWSTRADKDQAERRWNDSHSHLFGEREHEPVVEPERNEVWVISIGRNTHGFPMSLGRWEQFKAQTRLCFTRNNTLFFGEGTGVWDPTEDSFTIIGKAGGSQLRDDVLNYLGRLAETYHQESIAFSEGTTTFVTPSGALRASARRTSDT